MQNAKGIDIGVSPAFFVSRHGEGFGPAEVRSSLPLLSDLGYAAYQTEIFTPDALALWKPSDALSLTTFARGLGLESDIFVAHFLGHRFASVEALGDSDAGSDDLSRVLDLASYLDAPVTIVIPLLPFANAAQPDDKIWNLFAARIASFSSRIRAGGYQFAVEPVPGGLVNDIDTFERLVREPGCSGVGLVLDTGNLWAAGADVASAIPRLGKKLAATHLCDSLDPHTRSAEPGTGKIDWAELGLALLQSGILSRWDLEIVCPPEEVEAVYGRALRFARRLATAVPHATRSTT